MSRYLEQLRRQVLIYDGAMGTSIQALELGEADFGGPGLEGCNDNLVLTRPDAIEGVHASFLEVGCQAIETDTFRANRLTLREYGLESRVVELNRAAAALARRVADRFAAESGPRFVAGSIGPSGFLPGTSDPALGNITFDELAEAFREQARGLAEGGADLLLVETSQDMLEVKAQIHGIRRYFREAGARLPIQVQITLDTAGRMLLGTDVGAALVTLEAMRVDVIGLNCSTGPEHMRQPIRFLTETSRLPISVLPNAGIPINEGGQAIYPLTPEELAEAHEEFVTRFGVAIVGGCCGTTPEHLRQVVARVGGRRPARRSVQWQPRTASAIKAMSLVQEPSPALVGERLNAQGSRKVKRLLLAEDYDGLLQVARQQVEGGAHFLDVCVALTERRDEADQMRQLVKLLAQGVEAPLFIDTTEVPVVEAALKQYPGRAVINSINLEDGRARADAVLALAREHGAAVVALTIDPEGMARTAERKLDVARQIHRIAVEDYGLAPEDLIFDALTFTLATGEDEYRRSALETMAGISAIKEALPGVLTLLGVSNVSFGLGGRARAVLNSVFLHHCARAGLDLAIVNPAHVIPFAEIPPEERELADDLIHARRPDALPRFIAHFEASSAEPEAIGDPTAEMEPEAAMHWQILHRRREGVEDLVDLLVGRRGGGHDAAVQVLNHVLLPAMKEVGDKFGSGELILPFVLQSAEVMKRSVTRLETHLDRVGGQSKGRVVLATVFGDVHDIGKNLVHTILENNGYTVDDLGKQVPVNTIIERAVEVEADAIGLSALLVSTSRQMPLCVQELHARGLRIPVLAGGAAINPSFIRGAAFVDEAAEQLYEPGIFYCKDAFEGLATVEALVDPARREGFIAEHLEAVTQGIARRAKLKATRPAPREIDASGPSPVEPPTPAFWGVRLVDELPLREIFEFIDLNTLYRLHWGAKNAKGERWERLVRDEFEPRLRRYQQEALGGSEFRVRAVYGFFPAAADGDDLVIFDPDAHERELGRFAFPRQPDRERLCLADYFAPRQQGSTDVVGLQLVTVGDAVLERTQSLMGAGDYGEGYYLHGFGVRLAEAGAEYVHRLVRRDLGIPETRGLRYSWGYPACPDTRQHEVLYRLLPAREMLRMDLTEAGALVPELSTAALVSHHPECKYFSAADPAGSGRPGS